MSCKFTAGGGYSCSTAVQISQANKTVFSEELKQVTTNAQANKMLRLKRCMDVEWRRIKSSAHYRKIRGFRASCFCPARPPTSNWWAKLSTQACWRRSNASLYASTTGARDARDEILYISVCGLTEKCAYQQINTGVRTPQSLSKRVRIHNDNWR